MEIRDEQPGDEAAIAFLITEAFAGAEHSSGTEAAILAELRNEGALTLSLVVEEDGELIAHIAFSKVTIDGRDMGWLGLGPVAVKPDRHGEGIGSMLIRQGLAQLKHMGASGCVLVGEPAFYARFGFAAAHGLKYPGVPSEYFQALAFAGAVPSGTVAYHPAFG